MLGKTVSSATGNDTENEKGKHQAKNTSLWELEEITLCPQDWASIQSNSVYFGATVGRIANRIAHGEFQIEKTGQIYNIPINNGRNSLHGGIYGFDKKKWQGKILDDQSIVFNYVSNDGEEGFPGNLDCTVRYSLREVEKNGTITSCELKMDYYGECSGKPTVCALTNHTYWNLSGNYKENIYGHSLHMPSCNKFFDIDEHQIPYEDEKLADEYPLFDFRKKKAGEKGKQVGDNIQAVDGGGKPGYDHCFLIEDYRPFDKSQITFKKNGSNIEMMPKSLSRPDDLYPFNESFDDKVGNLRLIATLEEANSGRCMDVYGTQPGCQIYTANWFGVDPKAFPYVDHNAICIETEFPPNSINMEKYKNDIILQPGESYKHRTCHLFYTR